MLIREMLRSFEPYEWEPSSEEIAERVGLSPSRIIRLDTNTSPIPPAGVLRSAARLLPRLPVNQYPDTSYRALREALSSYTGCPPGSIIPTNGADEAIDIITRVLLEKGYAALASTPTYSYFRIATELQGGRYIRVPRREGFGDDVDALLSSIDRDVRLIFLCSPNNPTGNTTPPSLVEKICRETEAGVVVDEAYYEYSGSTVSDLLSKHPNLMVVRTLSKAFSFAGLRIGYILAAEETVRVLNMARPPNSLGVINIEVAKIALRRRGYMRRIVGLIKKERELLRRALERIDGIRVYPSEANFLLVEFGDRDAHRVYEELLERGIVVRDLSQNAGTRNCLRITVGTPQQNRRLIKSLGEVLS